MPETFQEVLTAAVNDIAASGYDSPERVQRWVERIERAAADALVPEAVAQRRLRDALQATYDRFVERGGAVREGLADRFTLQQVKPRLRLELDRRILASADLIKLNRREAISDTLRRFRGWATSIPPGGSRAVDKADEKRDIRKGLTQLPFRERRVAIDQGHKFLSNLSEIIATDGGAIAGTWRSRWRQPGYDYRKDHKDRDGEVFLVRGSWAQREGLVRPGPAGYADQVTKPGEEVFCRCKYQWLFNLRDLPADMLTAKGRASLAQVRLAIADSADAPGDAEDGLSERNARALAAAKRADRLEYLVGLSRVGEVEQEGDDFHSWYDPDDDEIGLKPNFAKRPLDERVHMLLHEAGHRGQEVDGPTWDAFVKAGLATGAAFKSMANTAHRRRGARGRELAEEVFAESYARFCLDLDMPGQLREFWRGRL